MTENLENILIRVTELIDLGLWNERGESGVEHLLVTKNLEQSFVLDLMQKNTERYQLLVGFCYSLGIGTVKDEEKAVKHWAKDITSYGYYLVGRSYVYGSGVDINYNKALLQLKLSVEAGNSSGQNILGYCYEKGKGVEVDLAKAFHWYQKSAEAGNSTAQGNLGSCYEHGEGAEIDLAK